MAAADGGDSGSSATGKGSILDIWAQHYIYQEGKGQKGPDTTFIRKGSVLAIRAGHNIY